MRFRKTVLCLIALLIMANANPVAAGRGWLDDDVTWNSAGMLVPAAPSPPDEGDPRCQGLVRPAETSEDDRLIASGWRLYADYRRGWGLTLVGGFLNFDAMCRPVPFQQFVFAGDVFVGTLAPQPMLPRTDGALTDARIIGEDTVYAVYVRYAATDALCCPSAETRVTFVIEETPAGPVLVRQSTDTMSTS
jgi:hypothetical protein